MKKLFLLGLISIVLFSCNSDANKPVEKPAFSVKTDKTEYNVGDVIKVEFVADSTWDKNAWVGLIPSEVAHGTEEENDKFDIAYKYLESKSSGTLEFIATKAGKFDVRMNESDSKQGAKEISSFSFVVKGPQFSVSTDKAEYKVGEIIKVTFTADSTWDKNAWIGLIPSDIPHGLEAKNDEHDIAYKYLNGKASGVVELTASKSGNFDVRMNESDAKENAKEISSASFIVK